MADYADIGIIGQPMMHPMKNKNNITRILLILKLSIHGISFVYMTLPIVIR